ncbi:MAG: DNA translocase FtsK [Candidatus Omnitrophota bacterium]
MTRQYVNEIKAIVILAAAVILFLSFVSFVPEDLSWYTSHPNVPAKNLIRIVGAYAAGTLFFIFGYSAYAVTLFLFFWGWNKISSLDLRFSFSKGVSFITLLCVLSSLFSMVGSQVSSLRFQRSGLVGFFISDFFVQYFGRVGAYIFLILFGMVALILIGEFLISPFLFKVSGAVKDSMGIIKDKVQDGKEKASLFRPRVQEKEDAKQKAPPKSLFPQKEKPAKENQKDVKAPAEPKPAFKDSAKPNIRVAAPPVKEERSALISKPRTVGEYHLPSLDLLNDPPPVSSRKLQEDLMGGAKVLEETLAEFGVTIRVADVERGPVITRYEVELAPGVKVQQITTLSDDIALVMKAQTVRMIAPIPGKNRVGIEVPNTSTSLVYLKDVLSQSEFRTTKSKLPLALGKDTAGNSLIADLSGMPHLLIAGTTGAGKTVCVNSVIMSMLFNSAPEELKFLMIDPKMVELSIYNALPHMLCPAVTDHRKVSAALNWVVGEMENRYTVLAKDGVRNIEGYNTKNTEQKLPYIVVIIDELADLMQVSAKQIESAITRLAQLSRAVGIHLILATQRPSVDVITGVIKANFPARISFKVASKVDSRTVLDMNGAEKLLGRGDMLFLKPGEAKPIRAQCSLVGDDEIQKVIDFIKVQQEPLYDESIVKQQTGGATGTIQEKDERYDEAVQLVVENNQASTSLLQRRLGLGYGRAARLIDMMEQQGIVGPLNGSKPREILINREEWLLKNVKQNG